MRTVLLGTTLPVTVRTFLAAAVLAMAVFARFLSTAGFDVMVNISRYEHGFSMRVWWYSMMGTVMVHGEAPLTPWVGGYHWLSCVEFCFVRISWESWLGKHNWTVVDVRHLIEE